MTKPEESAAIEQLISTHRALLLDGGDGDTVTFACNLQRQVIRQTQAFHRIVQHRFVHCLTGVPFAGRAEVGSEAGYSTFPATSTFCVLRVPRTGNLFGRSLAEQFDCET